MCHIWSLLSYLHHFCSKCILYIIPRGLQRLRWRPSLFISSLMILRQQEFVVLCVLVSWAAFQHSFCLWFNSCCSDESVPLGFYSTCSRRKGIQLMQICSTCPRKCYSGSTRTSIGRKATENRLTKVHLENGSWNSGGGRLIISTVTWQSVNSICMCLLLVIFVTIVKTCSLMTHFSRGLLNGDVTGIESLSHGISRKKTWILWKQS